MASPYNPTTGNRYRGVNILALMANAYTDPRWMTYKQAQAQGWQVRGGEKGTQNQHWIWEEARPRLGKDGKPELDNDGKPIKDMVRLSRPKVLVAAVFNAEQIDGIPDLEPVRDVGWDPLEKAERLLGASQAKIQHSQGGGAFYRPSTDTIHLPSRKQFEKAAGYYAVALHELGQNAVTRIMPHGRSMWRIALVRPCGVRHNQVLLGTPTVRRLVGNGQG